MSITYDTILPIHSDSYTRFWCKPFAQSQIDTKGTTIREYIREIGAIRVSSPLIPADPLAFSFCMSFLGKKPMTPYISDNAMPERLVPRMLLLGRDIRNVYYVLLQTSLYSSRVFLLTHAGHTGRNCQFS